MNGKRICIEAIDERKIERICIDAIDERKIDYKAINNRIKKTYSSL
jgi:hypothetical protein